MEENKEGESRYWTELHSAAHTGDFTQLKAVLNLSRELLNHQEPDGKSALHVAIEAGHFEIAYYLIAERADLKIPERNLWLPIHYAARKKTAETVIEKMLEVDSSLINALENHHKTPLFISIEYNCLDLFKYLITTDNVNLTLRDKNGWHFIHYVAMYEHGIDFFKFLENKEKSLLNLKTRCGKSVLDVAFECNSKQIVEYLSVVQEVKVIPGAPDNVNRFTGQGGSLGIL